jgi:tetratricopeptide (TPR) repeat protein
MRSLSSPRLLDDLKRGFSVRDRAGINAITAELLRRDAPIGRQWRTLADVMLRNGELTLARSAISRYVAVESHAPMARFQEAVVLARSGAVPAARVIMAELPKDVPDRAGHAYLWGTIEAALGHWTAARDHLLMAVETRPDSGQAWLALAMTGVECGDAAIATRLLDAAPALVEASALDRAQYHFARGKVLDDRGEHDPAFSAFEDGCAIMRAERPHEDDRDARSAERATQGFDRETLDCVAGEVTVGTARPIFVTGAPRSGSTLVEQILTSHSAVSDGEELGKFGLIGEELDGFSGMALARWLEEGNSVDTLAALYLHFVRERFGDSGRIVDKTLDASRYLGVVAATLPDAPLIWMRRNRLDGALSCFRTYFARGIDWSYNQRQIARHFALEDALLTRWRALLGERLLVVDYEELVKSPHEMIPIILSHCGLDVEPGVFTPHLTGRVVSTASVAQVREPINVRAVGNAEPYRTNLQPFIDAYRELGGKID